MDAKRNRRRILVVSTLFLLGLGAGWVAGSQHLAASARLSVGHEQRQGGWRFISPLLECEVAANTEGFRELKPFKYRVEKLVAEKLRSGVATDVSVYFRDLNNGPWFGIDEQAAFSPASLVKVPVMMAFFKLAESRPEILTTKVRNPGIYAGNTAKAIRSSEEIEPGATYTIDELILRMIAHSDNDAFRLLLDHIDPELIIKVFADLDAAYVPDAQADFMSVKAYSGFYRVLYNASYLNKEMSERALLYLSQEDFSAGILAGVPPGTVVASKYGERSLGRGGEIRQLHEFGIIYYPGHPYLLGVMTRGSDLDRLAGVLRDVSGLIYQEVDRQRKGGY